MQLPSTPLPVFIIGAGGIVNEAHLPAYRIARFNVQGIFDIDYDKAKHTADKFNIPCVFKNFEEMIRVAGTNSVFDVAIPASEIISVLEKLPVRSLVLFQKPMGQNLAEAKKMCTLPGNFGIFYTVLRGSKFYTIVFITLI